MPPRDRVARRGTRVSTAGASSISRRWSSCAEVDGLVHRRHVGQPEEVGDQRGRARCPGLGRRRRGPPTTAPRRRAPGRRPSRRRCGRARRTGRAGRRGPRPTQLMPAPQTTATRVGGVGAGPQQGEACRCRRRRSRPSPGPVHGRRRATPSRREVDAGQVDLGPVGHRRRGRPGRPARRPSGPGRRAGRRRPRTPEVVGRGPGPARPGSGPARPRSTSTTSVLLFPPSMARTAASRRRSLRPAAGGRGCAASSRSVSLLGLVDLADQRVGEQRLEAPGRGRRGPPRPARAARRPTTCATRPGVQRRRAASTGSGGARRRGRRVAGTSIDGVVGQEGQRAVVAQVHHLRRRRGRR